MKKIIIILLIVGAVVWGMDNRRKVDEYVSQAKAWFNVTILKKEPPPDIEDSDVTDSDKKGTAPESEIAQTNPSKNKPSSTPTPIEGLPTPLPEAYYYTKERITKITNLGVAAIAKGIKVKKIGEENGDYLVTDGTLELIAAPFKLTRDPREIAALVAEMNPPIQAGKKDSKSGDKKTTTTAPKTPAVTTAKKPHPELASTKARLQSLNDQIYQTQRELNELKATQAFDKMRGRATSTHVKIQKVETRLGQLKAEKTKVSQKLLEIQ